MAHDEYCAYSHLSAMLDRTGVDWILGMYEAYWDDSGTDSSSQTVVAACYVSTQNGWNAFVRQWDQAREEEDFDYFHMADFAARKELGIKPYCDWDATKRSRVYRRLAGIINENKWVGFGIAIPRDVFEREVPKLPEPIRKKCGKHVFTFAFKSVLKVIENWRKDYSITAPMRYVFDQMGKGIGEVKEVWDKETIDRYGLFERLGLEPESAQGISFEDKRYFKPLQAADILACQQRNHLCKVILAGKDDVEDCHPHFRMLRLDQHMRLGTEENFLATIRREMTPKDGILQNNDANGEGETAQ